MGLILINSMSAILEEALKLPIAERVRLADALYNSVGDPNGSVPLTDEQLKELARRIDDYEKNPGTCRSWEEIRDAALSR